MFCNCELHRSQMRNLYIMTASVHPNLIPVAKRLWVHYASAQDLGKKKTIKLVDEIFKLLPKDDDAVSPEIFAKIYHSLFPIEFVSETLTTVRKFLKIRPLAALDEKISFFVLMRLALDVKSKKNSHVFFDKLIQKQMERFLLDHPDELRLLTPECDVQLADSIRSWSECTNDEERKLIFHEGNIRQVLEQALYCKWEALRDFCIDWIEDRMHLSLLPSEEGTFRFCSTTLPATEAARAISSLNPKNLDFSFFIKDQEKLSFLFSMLEQLVTPTIELSLDSLDLSKNDAQSLINILKTSQIKTLRLNNCNINLYDMLDIIRAIGENSSAIQTLEINYRSITIFEKTILLRDLKLQEDAEEISNRDLGLQKNIPQKESKKLAQLESTWNERFSLESIELNQLKTDAYTAMIRNCVSLKHLVLCDQTVGGFEHYALANAIKQSSSLQSLHIEFHSSVKDSAAIFLDIANSCRSLKEIKFTDKNINDSDAKKLVEEAKRKNAGLKKIKIFNDAFIESAIASLHEAKS